MASSAFPLGFLGGVLLVLGFFCYEQVVRPLHRNAATHALCKRWMDTVAVFLIPGAVLFFAGSALTFHVDGAWAWFACGMALGIPFGLLGSVLAAVHVAGSWRGRLIDLREPGCLTPEGERVCREFWHGKAHYLAAFLDSVSMCDDKDALAPRVVERLAPPESDPARPTKPVREPGNDELRMRLIERLREREQRLLDQVAGEEDERDAVRAHTHQRMLEVEHMSRAQLREELGP